MTRAGLPTSFYEGYWEDLPRFSQPVQQRLKTFLELVGFDPDDPGLLAACQPGRDWFRLIYGYPLSEGYVIFWRVLRGPKVPGRSLAPPKEIEVLAIAKP